MTGGEETCMDARELLGTLEGIACRSAWPDSRALYDSTFEALEAMRGLSDSERPRSPLGEPGGAVRVAAPSVVIIPDIHGRADIFPDLLKSEWPFPPGGRIAEMALDGGLSIVCLGDIFNCEGPEASVRWLAAAEAVTDDTDSILSAEMNLEMTYSYVALQTAQFLLRAMPHAFFCLKGNHDNALGLRDGGDTPFYKYACESAMGAAWSMLRYEEETLLEVRRYEKLLPLVAIGENFCASHAEPAFAIDPGGLLEYRRRPDISRALIWTANGEAAPGAVGESLMALAGEPPSAETKYRWISGHRPVAEAYGLRANGLLVQIHNPARRQVAVITPNRRETSPAVRILGISAGGGPMRELGIA